MDPLFDASGQVYAWLERATGRILDLRGRHLAFLEADSIYNWRGRHVAWWHGDHARNQSGKVAVFLKNANTAVMGVARPWLKPPPPRPTPAIAPSKPGMAFRPPRPAPESAWASVVPF